MWTHLWDPQDVSGASTCLKAMFIPTVLLFTCFSGAIEPQNSKSERATRDYLFQKPHFADEEFKKFEELQPCHCSLASMKQIRELQFRQSES